MSDTYKIETKEELLEKLNEEFEILESIYDGEGVVVERPEETKVLDLSVNTESSGASIGNEDQPVSQFAVRCLLDIKPAAGMDLNKIGLLLQTELTFDQFYPYRAPTISFKTKKGLDDNIWQEISDLFNQE